MIKERLFSILSHHRWEWPEKTEMGLKAKPVSLENPTLKDNCQCIVQPLYHHHLYDIWCAECFSGFFFFHELHKFQNFYT